MIFEFTDEAAKQLDYWRRKDPAKVKRIKQLLKAIEVDAFAGVGKPEPLKHQLSGWWSRRIDREHRLVYQANGDRCTVLSCRFHY